MNPVKSGNRAISVQTKGQPLAIVAAVTQTPVPGGGTSCRPLLPKIIRAAATSASRRMTLTVQAAALLPPRDRTGLTMLTAMAAIFIVLSIGILIAHALDAFRSR